MSSIKNLLYAESVDFSALLAVKLKEPGRSQAAFARQVGVTGPFVNMICRGKATPPLDTIDAWADALELQGLYRKEFKLLAGLAHVPDQAVREFIADELADLRQQVAVLADRVELVEKRSPK